MHGRPLASDVLIIPKVRKAKNGYLSKKKREISGR